MLRFQLLGWHSKETGTPHREYRQLHCLETCTKNGSCGLRCQAECEPVVAQGFQCDQLDTTADGAARPDATAGMSMVVMKAATPR